MGLTLDASGRAVRVRSLVDTRGLDLTKDERRVLRVAVRRSVPGASRRWLEKGLLLGGAVLLAVMLVSMYRAANLRDPVPVLLVFGPFVLGCVACLLAFWRFDASMRLKPPKEEAEAWLSIDRCPHCAYKLQKPVVKEPVVKEPVAREPVRICPECGSAWRG